MKKTVVVSSIVAGVLFTGCGGDITSSASSSVAPESTGYFVDSAVAGLEYNTSSNHSGVTGKLGDFKYNTGDKVTFKIGKVILGTVDMDREQEIVTPEHISDDANETTRVLQLLQSLDNDHNASNGIVIDKEYTEQLKNLDKEIHITKEDSDKELLQELSKHNSSKDVAEHLDNDYDGEFDVNATKAKEHFEKTKTKLDNGWTPEKEKEKEKEKDSEHGQKGKGFQDNIDGIESSPKSTLTEELKNALSYMEAEERLAYDVYKSLSVKYSDTKVFDNIATRSESRHIETTYKLLEKYNLNTAPLIRVEDMAYATIAGKYDIEAIQALYDNLVEEGSASKVDALKVGCKVEVVDVNDLNEYITLAKESSAVDIQEAFEFLRDASYKHYWAFDKQLKNEGVTDGCCSAGDDYCKTQLDYPKD